ncbi:helicase-related protein [Jatrophihabitans sp.]|uniref:helicase-related protein n=1 Tax=Jatrophihabitans sp. TaxID=1932789 RepID=UPI0030C6A03A|nr:methylase [Jatrophihabitans sp.]
MGATAELEALHELRAAARVLLAQEADATVDDAALAPIRSRALACYRQYVRQFGALNRGELIEGPADPQSEQPSLRWRRPALGGFRADPDYFTVMALEVFDQQTGAAEPAPILLRRVHGRPEPASRVANVEEALIVSRGEGGLDLDRVAGLLGLPGPAAAREALGDRLVADPERGGALVATEEYLCGDVRARLAVARQAAADDERYRRNVELLAAVEPPEVGPFEIAVSLGAPWIEPEDVELFIREVLGGRARVWHLPSAAFWKIVPLGKEPAGKYGTGRMSAYEVLSHGLNGRTPIVVDLVSTNVPGKRIRRRNIAESVAAQDRLSALQAAFTDWLWQDAGRTERLVAEYNRRFTSHRPRRPDGSGLTLPGLADGIELWPWQRDIVARALTAPATLCAHAVGAGKTRSMAVLAMTARRLGLARKPLVSVPAHLVEQTAREFRQAYPFGRFLVAGEDGAGSRARLAARCATGDWDAVIVSHGVFSALPVAPEVERSWLRKRLGEAEAEIRGGRGGRHGRTVLRRRMAGIEARLARLAELAPPPVTFDELGIDLLLVDEAHYFKRLPITSRREGVSLGSSQRAADLLLKAQLLRERRGPQPSLALFTGTPWSNTIAETFVWQTFVQPDRLAAAGIDNFDAWAAVFVEYDELVEVAPDSAGFRMKQRPSRIRNLPELRSMLADAADVLPGTALGVERPERRDETIVCDPSPGQRAYIGSLELRADKIRRSRTHGVPGEDNMLALCGDGRRVALDPRLVGVPEESSKVVAVAEQVARLHAEHLQTRLPGSDVPGVLQIVFCDQGTPGSGGLQTYGRLRLAIVARGVPAERVRWVHEAATPAERVALFAACRSGEVSVLLGSTDTLGTGANVQPRLRALHHADAPWRPSDIEQREGRALRPGNLNPVVEVIRYVTQGTFDGYMWQTLERKARFISQLQHGMLDDDTGDRTVEDFGETVLSFAEVKALATGNPLLLEEAHAAADVARLRILRSVDAQTLTAARAAAVAAEADRYRLTQQARLLHSAVARLATAGPVTDNEADVRLAVADVVQRAGHPDPSGSAAPVRASWTGLGVEVIPVGGWRSARVDDLLVRVTLAHRAIDEFAVSARAVRRGDTPAAEKTVITALRRWRRRIEDRISEVTAAAVAAEEAAEQARATLREHRFDRARELAVAEQRLDLIRTTIEAAVDDLETENAG